MPNPTTINEDQPMTIPETIAKLRRLLIRAKKRGAFEAVISASDLSDIITIIESSESEKPKKWWTVADRIPEPRAVVLCRWRDIWRMAKYNSDEYGQYWQCSDFCGSELITAKDEDLWREMPQAPVIGEGK